LSKPTANYFFALSKSRRSTTTLITMNSFALFSFIVMMMSLNVVVADQFFVFSTPPNFNATSSKVKQTLDLYAAVAVDFTEILATSTTPGTTTDNLIRHLRGADGNNNVERRLPCGSTCYQCRNYYKNSLNYCQVICNLACRRRRELYPVTQTNPMDAFSSCVKEDPAKVVADAKVKAAQKGITSYANGLDPSQGTVEVYNCV
jgi:hypothetical protein